MAVASVENGTAVQQNFTPPVSKSALFDNIGEEEGAVYEEGLFEGYGPGGVAIIVETLTDNRNRTVSEVRHAFTKQNGNLGESGSVAWMFEQKGVLEVAKENIPEDDLMIAVMDVGAEDIQDGDEVHEVVAPVGDFEAVKKALEDGGIEFGQASLAWMPKSENMLEVQEYQAQKIIRLLEALEDLDDVQKVYSNFDLQEDALQQLMAQES